MEYINKEHLKSHKNITIRVEMDEIWSFYHDKKHQIRQWWAIDHETGAVIAFWFGTREDKNLDKLLELLEPFNIGKVYTDSNYEYYERFSSDVMNVTKKNKEKIERKYLSMRTCSSRLVRKWLRLSKIEQIHKIVAVLAINIRFLGRVCLLQ